MPPSPLSSAPAGLAARRRALQRLAAWSASSTALLTAGCALLPWSMSSPSVHLLGMNKLPGEPLERRFQLRLRIQNPNPKPIEFKGLALDLDLNNRTVGSGVTDAAGTLPAQG